jgi:flavorubredoxin
MHDSTREMVEHFVVALIDRGINVRQFNLTGVDIGELAIALVDAATVVIGSPTFLVGPHPTAAYAAMLANVLRPKTRFVSIIGSFGWAGKMVEELSGMLGNLKVEVIEPVITKGLAKDKDFVSLDLLADKIAAKHKEIGILK